MDDIDLNLNNAECVKNASGFTETLYYNICTGAEYAVPYGGLDYFALFAMVGLFIVVINR